MSEFLHPKQAYETYGLHVDMDDTGHSEIEQALAETGIAAIEMPLSSSDFERFSHGFATVIDECPELLAETAVRLDGRYGSEVGYTRKEGKVDPESGLQMTDPKSFFHFSERIRNDWRERFANGPKVLRDFLEDGFEIHDALIGVGRQVISELEVGHPNISQLYFPHDESFSFLRLLRYDGYYPHTGMGEVAKPHYDIGGVTVQAYADAPGFWTTKDGVDGERQHYDTEEGRAYTFLGKGHEKIYGRDDSLRPLWHGVDRIVPAGVTWVPERTAVILFIDAPDVDYHVRASDTLPQLHPQKVGRRVLAGVS